MIRNRIRHVLYNKVQPMTLCHEGCAGGGDCHLDNSIRHTWHTCNDENCVCHQYEPIEGINPRSYITIKKKRRR
jgi:hypothetical protein